ncbi:MAG: 2OG-Fe(II) oxygenase [Gammaproteobacteria bacterium]|nr:2OG-Fe(II) oxygenase [Gammaproteobacteria bacterium]
MENEAMSWRLSQVVDLEKCPLSSDGFRTACRRALSEDGALVMRDFMTTAALDSIRKDAVENQHSAYYTASKHNLYIAPSDPDFPPDHPRNREVLSSKGCITTDQIPADSALHCLYDAEEFRQFICAVLDEPELYEYADALSSINIHYAGEGQELGWHFDNSSFAITLMIQEAEEGGTFEYVKDVRDADSGEMNYDMAEKVLDGGIPADTLSAKAGTLVLFRGRNSMHRVTPVAGHRTRLLVVLAYNTESGISLSESARMTFYGRLG